MLTQSSEQGVVDAVRIESELLCPRQRGLLLLIERAVFKVDELLQLILRGAEPRSLRGV